MKRFHQLSALALLLLAGSASLSAQQSVTPVDHVSTLVGSASKFSLSTGNTYPAIALPWGMNFWVPQTGKMGDGWQYTYDANQIRGFKQTHQPSPWINDYGQFAIMPTVGKVDFDENRRASWFSHKAETASPYYYKVYLADYDVTTEITPTERAALFRLTFPATDSANILIDAFDHGSSITIQPEKRRIVGYTTRNSGGVPDHFKNYFVLEFDRPFTVSHVGSVDADYHFVASDDDCATADHAVAAVSFATKRGEQVGVRVASSFVSADQALENLKELGDADFDRLRQQGRDRWNDVLGRIEVSDAKAQPHRRDHAGLLPPPRTQHARPPFPSRAPRTVCRRMTTRSEDGLPKRDLRSQVTQGNCSAGIPLAIRQTIPVIQQQVLAMATTLSCQTFGRTSFFSYFCSIVAT